MKVHALVKQGIISSQIIGIFDSTRRVRSAFKAYQKIVDTTAYHHDLDGYHEFYSVPIKLNKLNPVDGVKTFEMLPYDIVKDGKKLNA